MIELIHPKLSRVHKNLTKNNSFKYHLFNTINLKYDYNLFQFRGFSSKDEERSEADPENGTQIQKVASQEILTTDTLLVKFHSTPKDKTLNQHLNFSVPSLHTNMKKQEHISLSSSSDKASTTILGGTNRH